MDAIEVDSFLGKKLEEYKEVWEQWEIFQNCKNGRCDSIPSVQVILAIAVEDEIRELKELIKGERYTVEQCQKAYERLNYSTILNDGKVIGYKAEKAG